MDQLLSYIVKMGIVPINLCFICLNVNLQIMTILCLRDKIEEAVIFT
jgi:hypothetical protein